MASFQIRSAPYVGILGSAQISCETDWVKTLCHCMFSPRRWPRMPIWRKTPLKVWVGTSVSITQNSMLNSTVITTIENILVILVSNLGLLQYISAVHCI